MSESKQTRKRPKNQYLPWLRLLIRLLIVAAVLLVIVLVWNNWGKIAPEAILDWAEIRFGEAQVGSGFPVAVEGNSVVAMSESGQYLVSVTDTSLQYYNRSASRVVTRQHAFSDPVMHTAGRYVLLAEVGGSRFRLDTRRETVLEKELENRKIYAACVLSSGMTAVITDSASQSYQCEIRVFDRKGNEKFLYQCRRYILTNISLASNGKGLAAVGTTAEGGKLKSVLLTFDFSDKEPTEYSGADLLLYDVNYFSNGAVLAVGDQEMWLLRAHANKVEKIAYNGYEPVGYSATPTFAGLILQRSGSTGDTYVWTADGSGNILKSDKLDGNFRSCSCLNSELLVLTESHLYTFGTKGSQDSFETPSDSLLAAEYRDKPLLVTLGEIKRVEDAA